MSSALPNRSHTLTFSFKSFRIGTSEILLLLVTAVWGSSYAVSKQAMQHVAVLDFVALRFGLTFLLLMPAVLPLLAKSSRGSMWVGGLLGFNLFAVIACESFGVLNTSATNAAFLIGTTAVITPFMEWWTLGRRPSSRVLWAALACLAGAALLARPGNGTFAFGLGESLMLGAAVLRALMVCLTEKHRDERLSPIAVTALQCGMVAVLAWGLGRASRDSAQPVAPLPVAPEFWIALVYLVLLCTIFAFFAQNYSVPRVGPSRVAMLLGCEPLFGVLFAVLLLGESVRSTDWLGGALIVLAAWSVIRVSTSTKPLDAPGLPVRHPGPGGVH